MITPDSPEGSALRIFGETTLSRRIIKKMIEGVSAQFKSAEFPREAHPLKGLIKNLSTNPLFCLLILIPSLAVLVAPVTTQAVEDSARIYFLHAMKAKEEGDNLTAESFLRKAIEIEPDNPDFHFELGNLYIEQKNLESARMEFEQAVMILPTHLAAHYNLGLVYRDLRLMGDARNEFRKVLQLDPANLKAELQIGYTYQEESFFDDLKGQRIFLLRSPN